MKTYKERTESILRKTKIKKRQKNAVLAAVSTTIVGAAATALALVLFLPYPTEIPSVTEYQGSEYYSLIQRLNEITYEAPRYKNNFEKWTAELGDALEDKFGGVTFAPEGGLDFDVPEDGATAPGMDGAAGVPGMDSVTGGSASGGNTSAGNSSAGQYEETTDNQVQGVTEADLLKRTDKYAFYLTRKGNVWNENGYYESINGHLLRVYSIAGANSQEVKEIVIEEDEGVTFASAPEMYLSMDGTTLTVFSACYKGTTYSAREYYTAVISIDVRDPANAVETNRVYLSGSYISSRLVDGKLLVLNSYSVKNVDFRDESTYLPQYGAIDDMQSVEAEDIVCSEIATTAKYTVVTKLDEKTLAVEDSEALLSYSNVAYVSEANLFLTQSYVMQDEWTEERYETISMTEISCVNYAGEELEFKGAFSVEGSVKNQYSMDEYEGILRVATTYRRTVNDRKTNGDYSWVNTVSSVTNANLYCIDLTNFEVVGKVEKFAPAGETVESVRFDGAKAYVCTAVLITLTDPVFFFDLADPQNITWTDTGTIDGYSSSLIDFGHGYLVGIGYDRWRDLKIEVYTQGEGKVDSVCSYELDASFSETYKSYLIDRENGLIGLGVYAKVENEYTWAYLLLAFEGGEFTKTYLIPHEGSAENKRAFFEDGYLYLFGGEFKAVNIE